GETRDAVSVRRAVAAAAAAQLDDRHCMCAPEMLHLGCIERGVAAPAVHEDELGLACTVPLVVQPDAVPLRVRHARLHRSGNGPCRDRTCDLGIKSPLLYQLS